MIYISHLTFLASVKFNECWCRYWFLWQKEINRTLSNFDLYLMSHVYIKSFLEQVVDQLQNFKSSLMYPPPNFKTFNDLQTHNYIETGLNRDSKEGTPPLATIQAMRTSQWLAECGKWDMSTYNSNTIFYKALRGVSLMVILNKTSGCVPLCLNISPSTCLFKSLLLGKAWLYFWCPFGQKFSSRSSQRNHTHYGWSATFNYFISFFLECVCCLGDVGARK